MRVWLSAGRSTQVVVLLISTTDYAKRMAVWDDKPSDSEQPINWVELKTAEEIKDDRDTLKFERKLLKFWIQSFLLGVPKIIVGFRSRDGILKSVQEIETKSIPGNVKRQGKRSWDGNVCINFTAVFLDCMSGPTCKRKLLGSSADCGQG